MSSLLIPETPHQVIPSLAAEIGLNEAIFLQQLHWLIQNRECYYHEDKLWWYHSRQNWTKAFPYWSDTTVKRVVQSLKGKKLVIVKQLSKVILKKQTDRTSWFAINHEEVEKISLKVAHKKQAALEEKRKENPEGEPIKIKGSELIKNTPNSSVATVESPLGQNDPMEKVILTQSALGQNDPMFNKTYKKDLDSNKPAEAVFDFDLVLAWILVEFQKSGWFDLDSIDKAFIGKKLEEYQRKYKNPNEGDALSYVDIAMRQRHGIERRSMKASKARDKVNNSVVNQLEAQAAVIDQHTRNMKPKTLEEKLNDTSWAD